ncbi:MAG: type II toxin-antitoxin system VapC family toxin [Acidobacteriota bacterium]|nr:type II toxin-antitoxin system VapC family toxin [Acidobacteriota bacterium]
MILVVDASAISSIVFGEPEGPTIAAHIDGESLMAPTLFDYEMANIGWKKLRRHPDKHASLVAAMSRVPSLQITKVAVPLDELFALAVESGLTAYDASYLWLARSQDLELVTLDNQLARVNQAMRELD